MPKHQHLLNIPIDLFDLIAETAQNRQTSRTSVILDACQKLVESDLERQKRQESRWSVADQNDSRLLRKIPRR